MDERSRGAGRERKGREAERVIDAERAIEESARRDQVLPPHPEPPPQRETDAPAPDEDRKTADE